MSVKKKETEIKEKPSYKPVFIPITITKSIRRDVNYYGIKQKLKNVAGLDFFRKVKNGNGNKKKVKKEPIKITLWERYCNWFNNKFNKKVNE